MSNLSLKAVTIIPSTFGRSTPQIYATGCIDAVALRNCNVDASLLSKTNTTKPFVLWNGKVYSLAHSGKIKAVNSVVDTITTSSLIASDVVNSSFQGASAVIQYGYTEVALSGATTLVGGLIPANCFLIGVSRVVQAITGASGFQVGIVGAANRFADIDLTALGSSFNLGNRLPAEGLPRTYSASANIVITAKTSNFTGGRMKLFTAFVSMTPPVN